MRHPPNTVKRKIHVRLRLTCVFPTCIVCRMDIIAHIRANGLNVAEVCRRAGISRQTFYAAIKPHANAKRNTLAAIARETGLAMEDIGGEGPRITMEGQA